MRVKDVIYLVIAGILFTVVGIWAVMRFGKVGKEAQVEVVTKITAGFSQDALDVLSDPTQTIDFSKPIDLGHVGNETPFGVH